MRAASPAQLARACRAGDEAAWETLLERYGRLIWSIAHRLGARGDEAEEVFQRTWVAVVEGIGRLREPAKLGSFVTATARHQALRLLDERRRAARVGSLDGEPGAAPDLAAGADDQEARLERLEEQAALLAAVERLDPRCRQLVGLLFLDQRHPDYATVAAETGLAIGSIGPIRARCLKRLRRLLAELYQTPPDDD